MKFLYISITKEFYPVLYWMIAVLIFCYGILICKMLYELYKEIRKK
jgi:hypothetical protein